jgi:HK97 family phage major capsid protein
LEKILALREKRAAAVAAAREILDKATDGILSPEDTTAYENAERDIQAMTDQLSRLERQAELDASVSATAAPITNTPGGGTAPKTGRAAAAYKTAMLTALRSKFRRIEDVLEVGTDANGGYLVPEEYDRRLIDGLDEENIMRTLGTRITTSGEHKINIAGTKPAAAWIEEGGALTFGDATFAQITLDAHKLHVAVKVTEELLYDNAYNLEGYILDQFIKALGNAEEDAFINGDGTGKPLGILAPTGTLTAAGGGQIGVTTASATAIVSDEVINLVYKLKRPYRKNAAFLANDQTLAHLRKLKDTTGQYLWQPSYQAGEPDRLLGYPIHTSAFFPTVTAGTPALAFGDFSYYNIGDRGTRSFAELKELYAGNGMVGFVAKERVDGKLVLPEAVQILAMKA